MIDHPYFNALRYAGKMSGFDQSITAIALHWGNVLENSGFSQEAEEAKDIAFKAEELFRKVTDKLKEDMESRGEMVDDREKT